MPRKTIHRELVAAIRQITERYITFGEGTPAHVIKTKLGKKRDLLEEAVRRGYLRYTGPKYFPRFPALDLEGSHTRSLVEQCTTVVFKALRAIYERDGERMCNHDVILEMCKKIDPTASPEAVSVGMLFATDFSLLVHLWNGSGEHGSLNLAASDRLLDFNDLRSAWRQELKNGAKATAPAATSRTEPPQPGSTPLVFETTGETYTVEGIEGEGGTSVVHRVIDSEGKRWALKCLKPDQATASRTKRFLNELNFCQNCSHKNVVRVVDHGFVPQGDKKCPFFVMPLYSSTLRKVMRAGIPSTKVLHYFSEILDGVEAAHLQNVWHRDLKPENVLHDLGTDELVVSDFGVAHFTAEAMHTTVETKPLERLANFQYAAPEQRVPGGIVDRRADIYALGLILNEMFTGHVLQGTGFRQIGQAVQEFAYLDEIVDRMVQHLPENRPNSVDEIKKILIARKNDFIARQKLDQLRQTVVPSSTIVDPIIQNPPEVRSVNIQGESLIVSLSQSVSPEWIRAFRSIGSYSSLGGTEPANWNFYGRDATVSPPRHMLDTYAQQIVNHFKNYVGSANVLYRQQLEQQAREREEVEKRALRQAVADEERRGRILRGLKV